MTDDKRWDTASPRRSGGLFEVTLFLTLVIMIPMSVVAQTQNNSHSNAWVFTLAVAAASGTGLTWIIRAGEARLYLFCFTLFSYIFLGLAPTTVLRTRNYPSTTPNLVSSDFLPACVIVAIGLLSFAISYSSAAKRASRVSVKYKRCLSISIGRVKALAAISIIISVYYVRSIGAAVLFKARDDRILRIRTRFPASEVANLLASAAWVPLQIACLCMVYRNRELGVTKLSSRALVTAGIAITLLINNPLSGARYHVGAMYFGYVVAFGAVASRRRIRTTLALTLLAMMVVFPVADHFRRTDTSQAKTDLGLVSEYDGGGDYDSFPQIVNSVTVVGDEGLTLGHQALGVFGFFVPRSLWHSKPFDTSIWVAEHRGYEFTNLGLPLWAEFYVNFGFIGVALGFVLVGALLARLDRHLVQIRNYASPWYIASSTISLYTIIILRGSLLQAVALPGLAALSIALVSTRREVGAPLSGLPNRASEFECYA